MDTEGLVPLMDCETLVVISGLANVLLLCDNQHQM